MNQRKLTIQDYIEITLRRKWLLTFIFLLGTTISIAYSYRIHPIYRSSTLIMVEPQKIPTAYVSPTVTSTVQERLATISQQILSRTNLEKIILQFGLYNDQVKKNSHLISMLNQKLIALDNFDLKNLRRFMDLIKPSQSIPIEVLVERMRRDIEVKVTGGGNAFTVSYDAQEPMMAMRVTNTLASLFIEENLKLREQQAEGTSEFLGSQLKEAQTQLEKQERMLKEFKEKHMGALPGQLDSNLKTLDRLQLELQSITEALRSAEERKASIERLRLEFRTIDDSTKVLDETMASGLSGTQLDLPDIKLNQLKKELMRLQVEFHDHYPDILLLSKQIKDLEVQIRESVERGEVISRSSTPLRIINSARDQQLSLYSSEINLLNSEIEALKRRREDVGVQIKEYEKRVEATFPNEQAMFNLTRDYETSQRNYQALLEKRLNAKISENLEKKQKGEQFRILDPANIPLNPYKPNRRRIVLLGSLLSGSLGVGLIVFQEYARPSFRKAEDFQGAIDVPVFGTIPRNTAAQDKYRPLITLQEPESLAAEQYRILYTRIVQSNNGKPQTTIAISSALKGEGKTLTSLNLGLVMARDFGKKILLIEGDMKDPTISRYLKLNPPIGLLDIILNKTDIQPAILNFIVDNFSMIPSTKNVKNSSSILSSPEMSALVSSLKEQYDFILIDSPPIISLPDMNIIEKLVDEVILVIRAEKTSRDTVLTALNSLRSNKITGIILNDAPQPMRRYYRLIYGTT